MSTADGIITAGKIVLTDQFRNDDTFSRFRVSNPYTIFSFTHENQNQVNNRLVSTTTNNGTVTPDFTKSVGVLSVENVGDRAVEQSLYYPPHEPGYSRLVYISGCFNPLNANTSGIRARMGVFDDTSDKAVGADCLFGNGWFLEFNDGNLFISERTSVSGSQVDTAVAQAVWNVDSLDGTGVSGIELDPTENILLVIQIGLSQVRIGVLHQGVFAVAHVFNDSPIQTRTLPLRFEVENLSAGSLTYSMHSISGAIQSEGGIPRSISTRHYNSGFNTIRIQSGDSFTPVFSLRLSEDFPRSLLRITKISLFSTTNDDLIWELRDGCIVSGGVWTSIDSAAEYNDCPSSFSGGVKITGGFFTNNISINVLDDIFEYAFSEIDGTPTSLTLVLSNSLGNGKADIALAVDWVEL